jgi:hypothetical protein
MSGAITAEERAAKAFTEMAVCDAEDAETCDICKHDLTVVTAAIREAEDAALERAARLAAEHSVGFGCAALPDGIRALKSDGSGK